MDWSEISVLEVEQAGRVRGGEQDDSGEEGEEVEAEVVGEENEVGDEIE